MDDDGLSEVCAGCGLRHFGGLRHETCPTCGTPCLVMYGRTERREATDGFPRVCVPVGPYFDWSCPHEPHEWRCHLIAFPRRGAAALPEVVPLRRPRSAISTFEE